MASPSLTFKVMALRLSALMLTLMLTMASAGTEHTHPQDVATLSLSNPQPPAILSPTATATTLQTQP
eukprot:8454943-Alexandrium_andersonii.AAC.1